jgi:hypothetical protein
MSEAPDINVVYDWVDTTPMFSVEFQKETLEDGSERFIATCPNVPDLKPCYGEELVDANEEIHRRLWTYISSGRNVDAANE